MEKLVEKGLVRSIGLSNFNSCQIDAVLSVASIKPTVLQVMAAPHRSQHNTTQHNTAAPTRMDFSSFSQVFAIIVRVKNRLILRFCPTD